jgi:hypothetical protein
MQDNAGQSDNSPHRSKDAEKDFAVVSIEAADKFRARPEQCRLRPIPVSVP